ncbi:MAG TPA: MOSC domain-containing protein [Microbacteriaceae bacterium]|nr:MOSC domain-containing protein [Microbacteriaceae bacterium]
MPSVLAVCVVSALRSDAGPVGVTGIDKRPVDGPVRVGTYGLYADVQADRERHGGLDQAVYAYGEEDAEWWAREVGSEFPPGVFGENLRVEGFDVNAVRLGDRWRIGGGVLLEVTRPRKPCQTFARWVEEQGIAPASGWVKRFAAAGRLGPYLRVLRTGEVRSGDAIVVEPAPRGAPGLLEWAPA